MEKINLQIITPHGIFYNEPVEIVTLRTTEGEMGVMAGKSPLVASLAIADFHIGHTSDKYHRPAAIAGGLLYVTPNQIRILTDAIEYKDQIDIKRAEEAKRRIEAELQGKHDAAEEAELRVSLNRAINRINISRGGS